MTCTVMISTQDPYKIIVSIIRDFHRGILRDLFRSIWRDLMRSLCLMICVNKIKSCVRDALVDFTFALRVRDVIKIKHPPELYLSLVQLYCPGFEPRHRSQEKSQLLHLAKAQIKISATQKCRREKTRVVATFKNICLV